MVASCNVDVFFNKFQYFSKASEDLMFCCLIYPGLSSLSEMSCISTDLHPNQSMVLRHKNMLSLLLLFYVTITLSVGFSGTPNNGTPLW